MKFNDEVVREDLEFILNQDLDYGELKGKTILITGAAGMLASYLAYFFMYLNRKENYNIRLLALVRNEKKAWDRYAAFREDEHFRLLVQDVCSPISVGEHVDYIFHLAGNASPEFIMNDPVGIISANTVGTIHVLDFARKAGTKRVFYASTREVYGRTEGTAGKVDETCFGALDSMERRACYPESKRMAESILVSYYHQYGVDSVVARIAHSYGPGMAIENDGRVMADFISDVVHGRDIVLKSTGDAVRAFCYIADAVSAILTIMLKGEPGKAYNVANETEPVPIREAALQLAALFPEKNLKVVFDIPEEMSAGYSRMGRTALDTSRLEGLGWKPGIPLREGMRRTVRSFE